MYSPRLRITLDQFSSISQSCPSLCNPMNCSTSGLPIHHQLPEFTQTQCSLSRRCHPTISSSVVPFSSRLQSFPASGSFHMSQFFNQVPKYWNFSFSISPSNEYSGLVSFRIAWLDLLAVQGTLKSPTTPQFKGINSLALSFLHSPILTSTHDHWKNHSLD